MLNPIKNYKRILAIAIVIMMLPIYAYASVVGGERITKAEFIAKISDYFAWPHPNDYNDIWKAPLKQFNDVKTTDKYGKEIEVAYEEGIISPDAKGDFYPNKTISRQDAAVVLVKAFKITESDKQTGFSDSKSISKEAVRSVNALVELGYMSGKTDTLFAPNDPITKSEVDDIFNKITSSMVAPVQALPKPTVEPYTAPRRFIKLYDPTPGTKIYFTRATSNTGWPTVEDPTTFSTEYNIAVQGHMSEVVGSRSGAKPGDPTDTYVVYKAIAVKDGKVSPVQTFKWHMSRPNPDKTEFGFTKIQDKTNTSPAVYELYNNSETVRPMAWYIEGQNSGIVFDALQTDVAYHNLKEFIDKNMATKPYSVVIGHSHGDHDAQLKNFLDAGVPVYVSDRGLADLVSTANPAGTALLSSPTDQSKIKKVEEGDVFDLGGSILNVYALPGHSNSLVILQDKANGLIFATDIYGCTRIGSADNVGVSGLRADLLLSFAQQTYSNYKKDGGKTTMLFTGHDETALNDNNLKLFEAALQQVIDNGEAAITPTLRGGAIDALRTDAVNSRTTMVGDMWKDGTNWISLKLAGKIGDSTEYLSSTTDTKKLPYMSETSSINYNGKDGCMKYSVLSNIEIKGGELVGKTVEWDLPNTFTWIGQTITVKNALQNKFNPWSYNYTITVPKNNNNITIIPTTMSTKVKSIQINGEEVAYRSSNKVLVSDGSVITIKVVAPDNVTTSTYTFTVSQK